MTKAIKYKNDGADIKLISEDKFLEMVGD